METIVTKLMPFAASLTFCAAFTVSIIDLAKKKKLFESNSSIKLHTEQVCSLGGVAIFAAFWIAFCLFAEGFSRQAVAYLFAGSFFLFLTGVKDDMVGLPPLQRLLIQVGVASLLYYGGIQLTHLPGLEMALPPVASYFLTILLIGGIVNAFNFIDGINGLASGLALISALSFAVLFYLAGAMGYFAIALALAGAVLGFLIFNFGTARIFMGDNGSTFIGVMLSFLTIAYLGPQIQASIAGEVSPVILVSIMAVPLIDMLKVVTRRVLQRRSPFRGDLTHVHHLLAAKGYSPRRACCLLYAWSILLILLSFFFMPQNIYIALASVLVVGGVPYILLNFAGRQSKQRTPIKTSEAGEYL